jgi:hypothetical protein
VPVRPEVLGDLVPLGAEQEALVGAAAAGMGRVVFELDFFGGFVVLSFAGGKLYLLGFW